MEANPDKFHFINLGNTGSHTLQINDVSIKSTSSVTVFGITVHSKLNLNLT